MLRPSWKSWLFIVVLSAAIIALGWFCGARQGLFWSVPVVLSINYFLLIHWGFRATPLNQAQSLEGQDPWGINKTLKRLCELSQVPSMRAVVIDAATPQAFVLGRRRQSTTVYLTKGLLDSFTPEELHAVLAWNVSVVKCRLQFNFLILGAVSQLIFQINYFIDKFLIWALGTRARFPYSLLLWINWPVFFVLQKFNVSRKDYLSVDEAAAELIGDRETLCRALWKLDAYGSTRPLAANPAWSHAFMVSPFHPHSTRGPLRYLQPQPPVKRRIIELMGAYPI